MVDDSDDDSGPRLGHGERARVWGEGVIGVAEDGRLQVSVEAMPKVDRKLSCALPVLAKADSAPDYPGLVGGCFLARSRGQLVAVTAWHNVRGVAIDDILVPRGFGADSGWFAWIDGAHPVAERPEDFGDVAVLLASGDTQLDPDIVPLDLDHDAIAHPDRLRDGSLVAVHGHPQGAAASTTRRARWRAARTPSLGPTGGATTSIGTCTG